MFFKSKPAGLTPRQRLVGDMQQSYPSVRAADAVGGAFELALRPSGVPMTLRIVLDATFPASRPDIQVYASVPISHPQIDPRTKQVINLPKLVYWNQSTSSLVDVLNEVIAICNVIGQQAITRGGGLATATPPAVAATPSGAVAAGSYTSMYLASSQQAQLPPPPSYNNSSSTGSISTSAHAAGSRPTPLYPGSSVSSMQQPQQSQQAQQGITHPPATSSIIPSEAVDTHHTPMPEVPLHFPELAGLSEAQLERLVADESALKVHMKTVGSVELMASMRDELRESNLQKILEALELEKEIDALTRQCAAGKRALQEEVEVYNTLYADMKRTYSVSKEMIVQELSQKLSACDERSEALGQDFVDGQKTMQAFLQEYLEVRKQYYVLNAKLESAKRS